jgi:hypothetical protein
MMAEEQKWHLGKDQVGQPEKTILSSAAMMG